MGTGRLMDSFRLGDEGLIGVLGHHDGEPLEVVRGEDGGVRHLVMSTFVLTRTPYDPGADPRRRPAHRSHDGPTRSHYWAWLTVDMLKSGTRRAGVAVRGK